MGENNCKPVWFNQDLKGLYDSLVEAGQTSRSFPDFVRDAFHDKVDSIREKGGSNNAF